MNKLINENPPFVQTVQCQTQKNTAATQNLNSRLNLQVCRLGIYYIYYILLHLFSYNFTQYKEVIEFDHTAEGLGGFHKDFHEFISKSFNSPWPPWPFYYHFIIPLHIDSM